jgi:hypothetical protein
MTDAPERIWRVKPWVASQHKHGLASWPVREHAGEGATEYVRADLHAEAIESADKRGYTRGIEDAYLACAAEYLKEETGTEEDAAYNGAVEHCMRAIRALLEQEKE